MTGLLEAKSKVSQKTLTNGSQEVHAFVCLCMCVVCEALHGCYVIVCVRCRSYCIFFKSQCCAIKHWLSQSLHLVNSASECVNLLVHFCVYLQMNVCVPQLLLSLQEIVILC